MSCLHESKIIEFYFSQGTSFIFEVFRGTYIEVNCKDYSYCKIMKTPFRLILSDITNKKE
ncbi:MAG: hypothetical protein A2007_05870 [Verrucomicrobia bacterium GWC2_42_7]|nr:MAG: hypothetical protein A2007_05870 [Verrucomicrobia bacterium GWC2_42_7]